MRRTRHGKISGAAAIALAVMSAIATGAHAQAVFSGSGAATGPDLGIGRMTAPYAIVHATGDWIQLGGELELNEIRPNGPAAGRVEEGDILIAVDGALITTREGSLHLFRAQTGRPVHLTVRRQGHDREVVIVPVAGAEGASTTAAAAAPPASAVPPAAVATVAKFKAPGRLGIGLACSCTMHSHADGAETWTFAESPEVRGVRQGGPAEQAGILVGDLLESVDGVPVTRPEGGRRWSAIAPGQRVRLGIRRGATNIDLVVLAAER